MLDYPQFVTVNTSVVSFEIDEDALAYIKPKIRKAYGISVWSEIFSFENLLLAISTEVNFIGIQQEDIVTGVKSAYLTIFKIENQKDLSSCVHQDSVSLPNKCYQLAEAYAYSMFSKKCTENDVPQSGMELTPEHKLTERIESFLIANSYPTN